jgi:hypothetical protein
LPKKVELLIWAKLNKYRLAKLGQVAVSLEEAGAQVSQLFVALRTCWGSGESEEKNIGFARFSEKWS